MRFTLRSTLMAIIAATGMAGAVFAQPTDYDIQRFAGGPGWLIFDEDVDVAIHAIRPDQPQCHELGEIVLLFDHADQLDDRDLIEASALKGLNRYLDLCGILGGTPSNSVRVAGVIRGVGEPDARGHVLGKAKVLDAAYSRLTGEYALTIRRVEVAGDDHQTPKGADAADADQVPRTYTTALAASMAHAEPISGLGRLAGGQRASLTGAWAGSASECATERLILFEHDGAGTAEWWRQTNTDAGLLPWRSGAWELRDDTLIMTFDHKVELSRVTGRLLEGPIDETVQFDLKKVDGSELRLAVTGGGFSPEALFLGGAEKLFVRCRN